jgi:hypothetical protein
MLDMHYGNNIYKNPKYGRCAWKKRNNEGKEVSRVDS